MTSLLNEFVSLLLRIFVLSKRKNVDLDSHRSAALHRLKPQVRFLSNVFPIFVPHNGSNSVYLLKVRGINNLEYIEHKKLIQ
jgi:hypothetical protein